MTRDRIDGTVLSIFSNTWPQNNSACQSGNATHHVNNGRSRKVYMAVSQVEIDSHLGKPATAPYPVSEQRVNKHGDKQSIYNKRFETPSFCQGTGRDGGRSIHKHHLE